MLIFLPEELYRAKEILELRCFTGKGAVIFASLSVGMQLEHTNQSQDMNNVF